MCLCVCACARDIIGITTNCFTFFFPHTCTGVCARAVYKTCAKTSLTYEYTHTLTSLQCKVQLREAQTRIEYEKSEAARERERESEREILWTQVEEQAQQLERVTLEDQQTRVRIAAGTFCVCVRVCVFVCVCVCVCMFVCMHVCA